MNTPRRIVLLLCAGVLALTTPPVGAADDPHPDAHPFNPTFAVYMGSGIYFVEGRSALLFRVPVGIRLRSEEEHAFGIRLRINVALGFYDLDPGDLGTIFDTENVATIALVPGIEFPIRIFDNWTMGPFLDLGSSYNNASDEWTGVLGTGFRSRAEFGGAGLQYLLFNELIYGNNLNTATVFDDFGLLRTAFDIRRLIRFRVFKRSNDFGLLFKNELYAGEVAFARPGLDSLVTRVRWEAGFTVGPTERVKVLKLITAPRFGVSYRFGGGTNAIRIIFRARY